jgi:hypothetical protein
MQTRPIGQNCVRVIDTILTHRPVYARRDRAK